MARSISAVLLFTHPNVEAMSVESFTIAIYGQFYRGWVKLGLSSSTLAFCLSLSSLKQILPKPLNYWQ